ncbi:MAG: sulfatase [Armatimonadota bacterium]|nr:MAG: sulfatase [Armatimonadota bacterium]
MRFTQLIESRSPRSHLAWLAAGLAAGVLVGLARFVVTPTAEGYLRHGLNGLLVRHLWYWLAAHGAAGLGLAAGLEPVIATRGVTRLRTWASIVAPVMGAAGLTVGWVGWGSGAARRLYDVLTPALPRGEPLGLGACAASFLGIGLMLSPVLAVLGFRLPEAPRVRAAAIATGGVAFALVLALGIGATLVRPRPLNVLFITLDAQRADHLGCYGYHRDTSPNLDALAARGVTFLEANANGPWTVPSVASIMTGKFPMDHGVTTARQAFPTSDWLMAKILQRHGYSTGGVAASGFVEPQYNVAQGFQWFVGDRLGGPEKAGLMRLDSPPWVTAKGITFIQRNRDRRFFLWLHYLKPHDPYVWREQHHFIAAHPKDLPDPVWLTWLMDNLHRLTPEQVRRVVDLYDGEVRNVDEYVGQVLAELERLSLAQHTLVIVSADHGEEFMQHGSFGHHYQLYQDELHVPLIIAAPGRIPAGRRVATPVQLVDLLPTILDLCNIPEEVPGGRGQSLVPLLTGRRGYKPGDIVAGLNRADGADDVEIMRSIRRGPWKLLVRVGEDEAELYDLDSDPGEQRNLAGHGLPAEQRLRTALSSYGRAKPSRPLTLTEETKKRLRSMGYLE